jgi:hypothetical protein
MVDEFPSLFRLFHASTTLKVLAFDVHIFKLISLFLLETVPSRIFECGTGITSEQFSSGRIIILSSFRGKINMVVLRFLFKSSCCQLVIFPPSKTVFRPKHKHFSDFYLLICLPGGQKEVPYSRIHSTTY